ncbi:EAL domain-containing protein [Sphingomonas sp.]|uniref:bifunctional diguanylate cyclase/phosphodiesterase n=1 Tax=Sphingomonas sp. TaxID=28214 RepID=UPI0035BC15D8
MPTAPPRVIVAALAGVPAFDLPSWPDAQAKAVDAIAADGSGGAIVLVDARGRRAEALAAVRQLASGGSAILAIAARGDARAFDAAGATHFLADPADVAEIDDALRFAARWPGTANRRVGDASPDEAAALAWVEANRPGHVILVALSRFDIVNAAYGRPAGDALLEVAERRIRTAAAAFARSHVARLDGATFLVAGDFVGEQATARLGDALARPFPVGDAMAVLGARFGVAVREAGDDGASLLRRAGEALAAVQLSDGATVRVADPDGAAPIATLAVDLHRAIERDEIAILFQPQVRIGTNDCGDRITGVEALARWDHSLLGPLGADLLFAAADRADLGLALSDHIQALALTRAAAWPTALAHLDLSLNVTAADIARAGFADAVLARVAASGFAPARLTIEITETALITDLAAAAETLATLRAAGVRVAIDDFGTGYASFAYLKALPLDRLKIDKSLAHDIVGSPRGRAVVRGIIAVADALGLAVVAEGVETQAERDLLANERCGHYQGFLCAGPLDDAALIDLVENRR